MLKNKNYVEIIGVLWYNKHGFKKNLRNGDGFYGKRIQLGLFACQLQ